MRKPYEPSSEFLIRLIHLDSSSSQIGGAEEAYELIRLMKDRDPANRDWATFLLGQDDIDIPEVREALTEAAHDPSASVRAEAILGLAKRDRKAALPLLRKELQSKVVAAPVFEAAALVADRSLVPTLRAFASPSADQYLNELTRAALEACDGQHLR